MFKLEWLACSRLSRSIKAVRPQKSPDAIFGDGCFASGHPRSDAFASPDPDLRRSRSGSGDHSCPSGSQVKV